MNFETVIGLEVHVELKTDSKVFSTSPAGFGANANANTSAYDWAMPGTMPILNQESIDYAMRASLALNMDINQYTHFDRKNYFYPDNPSSYQITQNALPIGHDGYIDIEVDGQVRRIGIERLHLEQDAGKNIHGDAGQSFVDLNRQGTSLAEIVTYPELRSADEAYAFVEKLRQIMMFTGVSDVRMEEGSLRCDANVSLRPIGQEEFNTKTEVKNLNSINFIRKAIQAEEKRQEKIYRTGGEVQMATMRFDDVNNETIIMRMNTDASDYRQIPEADVPPLVISDEWVEQVRSEIPEMPDVRRKRYVEEFGLPEYDAEVLTATKEMSDFFDETVNLGTDAKQASNWLMGEVSGYLNSEQLDLLETKLTPKNLSGMIGLIADGTISSKMAKKLFTELIKNGGDAKEVAEEKGLKQISDPAELGPIINEILDNNQQSIDDYKDGKGRALGFLVGETMKVTRGMANPEMVNKILREEIEKR